jgi:hypothetical protein
MWRYDGASISESVLVANLQTKREKQRRSHMCGENFHTIRGLQEDEVHIYVGYRWTNHV